MPRAGVRAAVLGALLALLTAFLPAGARAAAPSLAGTAGFCPDAGGVTVVVDFRELGGGRVVRCAPGGQADGLAALRDAGFQVNGTSRWGDSFVCRINNRPAPESEPCVDTPPASAYWSYWHADNGGSWTYSQLGATYRTPPEGSFEGWSFSLDRETGESPVPGVAPQRPAADDGGANGGANGGNGGDGSGSTSGTASGGGGSSGGGSSGSGGSGGSGDSGGTDGGSVDGGTGGQDGGAASAGGQPDPGDPGASAGPGDDATPPEADQDGTEPGEEERPTDEAGEPGTADGEEGADAEPGPTPTEDADWSGEDAEFEEQRAADRSSGPSVSTVAALGLIAALAGAAGLTAWRRRRAARSAGDA
ncbi:hypothetical protein [Streptomyces mayteni]